MTSGFHREDKILEGESGKTLSIVSILYIVFMPYAQEFHGEITIPVILQPSHQP